MTSSLSPITSERIIVTIVAGWAISAILPPFTLERCFLIVFNSLMFAPAFRRRSVTDCLSSRFKSVMGETRSDEAPPDSKQITNVFSSAFLSTSIISFVPLTPFKSGSGWDASICLIFLSVPACPYFTMTTPSSILFSNTSSTAHAIGTTAFPAPTTMIRLKSFRLYSPSERIILSPATLSLSMTAR